MAFGDIISSPRGDLSIQQALHLARIYLENARRETDPKIILVLCHDTEVSMAQVSGAAKRTKNPILREGIATIYANLGTLVDTQGYHIEAQAFYKKSGKWR
jgi:hypothetical protein